MMVQIIQNLNLTSISDSKTIFVLMLGDLDEYNELPNGFKLYEGSNNIITSMTLDELKRLTLKSIKFLACHDETFADLLQEDDDDNEIDTEGIIPQ